MNMEDELRGALRRKPVPPDFANRVMARIAEERPPAKAAPSAVRSGTLQWLAAAAVLTLVATGGTRYYEYRQTAAEAERVQAEIRLALQITTEKIALVQRKLDDTTR